MLNTQGHALYRFSYDDKHQFEIIYDELKDLGYEFLRRPGVNMSNFNRSVKRYSTAHSAVLLNRNSPRLLFGHNDKLRSTYSFQTLQDPIPFTALFTKEFREILIKNLREYDEKDNKPVQTDIFQVFG